MEKRQPKFYNIRFEGTEKEEVMFERVLELWRIKKENIFMWEKMLCLKHKFGSEI